MATLGQIVLQPAPQPAGSLDAYKQQVTVWTRQCERAIRQLESFLNTLSAEIDTMGGGGGSLPAGGTDGQVLTKQSSTDGDADWESIPVVHELPTGGSEGQVLAKASGTNYDVEWATPAGGTSARQRTVVLCSGFTPALLGADSAEVVVPFDTDGTTSVTWDVTRIEFRVAVAGGQPSVRVEKSSASGLFSGATVGDVTLADGAYEGSNTTSLGQVSSGDKLRFNALDLALAQGWTVQVELTEA